MEPFYQFHDDILILFSIPYNDTLSSITKLIYEKNPKNHVILWQPFEANDCRIDDYFFQDYKINPNHTNEVLEFENCLITSNIIFYYLVGTDKDVLFYNNVKTNPIKNFKMLYWPTSVLHYTYHAFRANYGKPLDIFKHKTEVNKLYTCLNGHVRLHRITMMDYLSKYNLMDYGYVTWNEHINVGETKYWKPKIMKIDEYDNSEVAHNFYTSTLLKLDNLVDVVTETYIQKNIIFHTEKTFRSILMGKPFLVLGEKNQNIFLTKYGYKNYTNIFNYGFDTYETVGERCMGIVDNLYTLKDGNYEKYRDMEMENIKHNLNRSEEIINDDPYFPNELLELIKNNRKTYDIILNQSNIIYACMYNIDPKFNLINEVLKNK